MNIRSLPSHVRFPSSTHFNKLKHNVEAYLKCENSEFCLHCVLIGSYDSQNKGVYLTKHS